MIRAVAAAGALALVGCGGSAVCGNGEVESGEQCDDGNLVDGDGCDACRLPDGPGTTVKWKFNPDQAPGFEDDSCIDVGAVQVEVVLVRDGEEVRTSREDCPQRQVVFGGLAPGRYTARVTPVDAAGGALVAAAIEQEFDNIGGALTVDVGVPPEAWLRAYTGSFYFTLRWGGRECAQASPPVTQHVLTLLQDGAPVALVTTAGDPVDGTAPGACQPSSETHTVLEVPFGHAALRVLGLDDIGEPQFETEFPTFVGAGVFNPEFAFDVAPIVPDPPDGGPIDAGPTDAGAPDA